MPQISKVVLVGHCGFDTSMIADAVRRASPDVTITHVNDEADLGGNLSPDVLLLVNRMLDGRFGAVDGTELIAQLTAGDDGPTVMLVSNYADAQQAAVQAGAVLGFGKSRLYDRVTLEHLARVIVGRVNQTSAS